MSSHEIDARLYTPAEVAAKIGGGATETAVRRLARCGLVAHERGSRMKILFRDHQIPDVSAALTVTHGGEVAVTPQAEISPRERALALLAGVKSVRV